MAMNTGQYRPVWVAFVDGGARGVDTAAGTRATPDPMIRGPSARGDLRRLIGVGMRVAAATAFAIACAAATAAERTPEPAHAPTVEDFFRYPFVRDAKLSLDGKLLALTAFASDGYARLFVADLSKPFALHDVAAFSEADVRQFFWVNDRRLVYDAEDLHSDRQTGNGGLWAG